MKIYSQVNKKKKFDWHKALSVDCNDMTDKYAQDLNVRSKSWVTCACGNQCAVIPRSNDGQPLDDMLEKLGAAFHNYGIGPMQFNIFCDNQKAANEHRKIAISYLKKIEKRSAQLIAVERKKAEAVLKLING
jgi:hypothetical protein